MHPPDFSLRHPCGLHITRDLPESEVTAVRGARVDQMGNGFAWHHLPVSPIGGGELGAALCYHLGKLVSISVRVGDSSIAECGWEDWSQANERACVKRTEKWLRALGYRPGNQRWYEIRVGYDIGSGSGGGVIRYHD